LIKTIEILIDTQGQTKIQTKGFTGSSCQEASRLLEQALGPTQSDVRTAEYFQPAAAPTEQQQRT
jgi:hypothetical protein